VLNETGWVTFLVKVHNEAGTTSALRVRSPQAARLHGSPAETVSDRWLDVALVQAAPREGGLAFGAALVLLAAWLALFDMARVTVRTQGLSRYMALALLAGYVWLGIGGVAWAASARVRTHRLSNTAPLTRGSRKA
jgi:hypothetical protein